MANVSLFWLTRRNALATGVIARYAGTHAAASVGIGVAGLVVPGGGLVSMIAALAMQAPVIYQPLAHDLATVYGAPPAALAAWCGGARLALPTLRTEASARAGDALASAFGQEFLRSLLKGMLPDLGIGAAVSLIPTVGGLIEAALCAPLARDA